VKRYESEERCPSCGRCNLRLAGHGARHNRAADCAGALGDCEGADFPHLQVFCFSCGFRTTRRPLDWIEPPTEANPLDSLLAEVRRALVAQFPDGRGELLFADVERRLRWHADYEKTATALRTQKGWLTRIFGD